MTIILEDNQSQLTIDLIGGRIMELTLDNLKILGTVKRIDNKIGNTHLCFPNFGAEGEVEYGLPFHGPARSSEWQINLQEKNHLAITYVMPQTGKYPQGLTVSQDFDLKENEFYHKISVTNNSTLALPVNLGIHNYWMAPSGWLGMRINNENVDSLIQSNGHIKLKNINQINFPHKKSLNFVVEGFTDAVLWTAFNSQKEYDSHYVCIEPVRSSSQNYFGSKDSLIGPGQTLALSQQISIT